MRDLTPRTSITDAGIVLRNRFEQRFVVEIVGTRGGGTFHRRSFTDAEACARKYAALFDAPREMFE